MIFRPRPKHVVTTVDREIMLAHENGRVHERYLRMSAPDVAQRHFKFDVLLLQIKELDNELIDLGKIGRFTFYKEMKLARQRQLLELKEEAVKKFLAFFRSEILSLSSGVYRDLLIEKVVRTFISFDELELARELTFELGSTEKRDELQKRIDKKAN